MSLAEGVGKLVKNGSIMRTGVCEGKSDSIGVVFEGTLHSVLSVICTDVSVRTGKAPFKASYTVAKGRGDPLPRTLSAIHPHADLKLFTNEPGHHVYVLRGVADSVYTTPEVGGLVSPAGGKEGILRVEQDVFPSPTASFRHGVKSSFCLNDPLASRSDQDLIVRLEGTAPFSLDIEVREDLHGTVQRFNIPNILTRDWPLSLPYIFSSASSHHLTILHLTDAHCASSVPSSPSSHLSLPVAQIPTLTPVLPQSDHCVGDLLQFDILGSPPLSLTYTFNSTSHTIPLSSPRFSRLASSPGLFKIVSIQHEGDDCPLTDIGLERRVWAIPEARVSEGRTVVAEMREGDQMEIVFSFVGTSLCLPLAVECD
jgi:nucleoporin POM152